MSARAMWVPAWVTDPRPRTPLEREPWVHTRIYLDPLDTAGLARVYSAEEIQAEQQRSEMYADLVRRTAEALGVTPADGWHGLPERAAELVAEREARGEPIAVVTREGGTLDILPAVGTVDGARALDALPHGALLYTGPQPEIPVGPVVAWAHPDGRVVPAATMEAARRDGGAMLSSLREYTRPLVESAAAPAAAGCRMSDEIKLPLPAGLLAHENGSGFVDCWTGDQMHAYAEQERAAERERCARLVRDAAAHGLCCSDGDELAQLIRAA